MNIFELYDLNSMTLKKLETLMGKIVFNGFFYVCVKFCGKKSLNVIVLSLFVGTVKM
jgi:hypothetical protein